MRDPGRGRARGDFARHVSAFWQLAALLAAFEGASMLRCRAGGAAACAQGVRAFGRRSRTLRDVDTPPQLLVLQPRGPDAEAHLRETLRLVTTLPGGQDASHELVQRVRSGDAATYLGSGTVQAIADRIASGDAAQTTVVVNARLSGVQERNLSNAWGGVRVLDRVALIIGVFAARAVSAESALQVELAKLSHEASRLVRSRETGGFGADGRTSVVSARQRGGNMAIGGEGESEIALQRRRIIARRAQLQAQLVTVERTRALHRARRAPSGHDVERDEARPPPLAHCAAPPDAESPPTRVALVGYTNAGKSSLAGALLGSERGFSAADALFHTLDTTTRAVLLPSRRRMLLSDTVGFVRDLPSALVAAFRSTLAEAAEADVVLHVLDASLPPREASAQRTAVHDTLRALGFSEGRLKHGMLEVYNKVDALSESGMRWQRPRDASWLSLPVSAATGEGIPLLRHAIDAAAQLAACHNAPIELRSRSDRRRDAAALAAAEAMS
jgi:50S ribosomal subunit-associated GTPase HflX